jgi:hypothetical protein
MMNLVETLMFLLWGLFLLAAVLGILTEYRSNRLSESSKTGLEDDDPVYLI